MVTSTSARETYFMVDITRFKRKKFSAIYGFMKARAAGTLKIPGYARVLYARPTWVRRDQDSTKPQDADWHERSEPEREAHGCAE